MEKYKIPNLNAKTTETDRAKLVTAIQAVPGVASATLRPASGEVEIQAKGQGELKRPEISSAASKVGFPLAPATK